MSENKLDPTKNISDAANEVEFLTNGKFHSLTDQLGSYFKSIPDRISNKEIFNKDFVKGYIILVARNNIFEINEIPEYRNLKNLVKDTLTNPEWENDISHLILNVEIYLKHINKELNDGIAITNDQFLEELTDIIDCSNEVIDWISKEFVLNSKKYKWHLNNENIIELAELFLLENKSSLRIESGKLKCMMSLERMKLWEKTNIIALRFLPPEKAVTDLD